MILYFDLVPCFVRSVLANCISEVKFQSHTIIFTGSDKILTPTKFLDNLRKLNEPVGDAGGYS